MSNFEVQGVMSNLEVPGVISNFSVHGLMSHLEVNGVMSNLEVQGVKGNAEVPGVMSNLEVPGVVCNLGFARVNEPFGALCLHISSYRNVQKNGSKWPKFCAVLVMQLQNKKCPYLGQRGSKSDCEVT